jgi:hypothetical protein
MHRALANPACAVITWHAPQTRLAGPGAGDVECQQGWHWGMDGRCRAAAAEPPEVSVRASSEPPGRGGDRASRTRIDDGGAEAPPNEHESRVRGHGRDGHTAVRHRAHSATRLRPSRPGGRPSRAPSGGRGPLSVEVGSADSRIRLQVVMAKRHARAWLGGHPLRYRWKRLGGNRP